ncbi:MAG: AraC family transcriptional regulator [Myxococcota bacterium]
MVTDSDTHEGACVGVDSRVSHALEARHALVALIDSESALAESIRTRFEDVRIGGALDVPRWDGTLESVGSLLASLQVATKIDPRIQRVLEWLDQVERSDSWLSVSLDQALRRVHLSRSRFLHLFSSEMGTPWRSYIKWRRALAAVSVAQSGCSLTEAAHRAGYPDAAHFSRQFVSLFGVTPSAFAHNGHFVQAVSDPDV